jgi:hypothetical protein
MAILKSYRYNKHDFVDETGDYVGATGHDEDVFDYCSYKCQMTNPNGEAPLDRFEDQ